MEEIVFEDGSGLRGDDACVRETTEDGGETWSPSIVGQMYYDADGDPWIGCHEGQMVNNDGSVPYLMPDTAMSPDGLPDITGLVLVLVLLATLVWQQWKDRS
jgi:hypothetical protein